MEGRPGPSKVAIPRLRRIKNERNTAVQRPSAPRVQKACNSCRIRKIRCNGDRPHCQNCLDLSVQCTYPLARKDRLKEANEQISRLVTLLNELSNHVDDFGQHKIEEVLASMSVIDPAAGVPSTTTWKDQAERSTHVAQRTDSMVKTDSSGPIDFSNHLDLESKAASSAYECSEGHNIGQGFGLQWCESIPNIMEPPLELAEMKAELSDTYMDQESQSDTKFGDIYGRKEHWGENIW